MIKPNSIDLVIYHRNCADGFGAAYSAWKLLGDKAEYYAALHNEDPPDVKNKRVAILDFSYKNKVLKQMIRDADELIVIDHHKSAMIDLQDIPNMIFDMDHSGARLAWDFFHPDKEPPKFINYIEDRDLWKWQLPQSREFSAAFDMVPFNFEEYQKLEDESVFEATVVHGTYILSYSKTVVEKICNMASPRKLRGLDVLVVNSSHLISDVGSKLARNCDFAMIWYYDHKRKKAKVSLRSRAEHIDVSEIAKFYGGGGHKRAAGFVLPTGYHVDHLFDVEQ